MRHVLQRLYESEINFGLVSHWHAGFEWWLGCSRGKGQWEDGWEDSFDEACAAITAAVVKRYPESDFAKEEKR